MVSAHVPGPGLRLKRGVNYVGILNKVTFDGDRYNTSVPIVEVRNGMFCNLARTARRLRIDTAKAFRTGIKEGCNMKRAEIR
jgi:hypothetical protein